MIEEKKIKVVIKNMLSKEKQNSLSRFFKIFGDETRLRILDVLKNDRMCVNDISYLLNMTQSSISHQLRILRDSNFVKDEKVGKIVYYSLADNHIKIILDIGVEHIEERG